MSVIDFSRRFFSYLVLLVALMTVVALSCLAVLGWEASAVENGAIENIQLLMLVTTCLVGALTSAWSRHLLRVAMAGWVAVALFMIQREVDFATFGEDTWLYRFSDNRVRAAFWLPIIAALLLWLAPYRRFALRSVASLRWRHLWPTLLMGGLIFVSWLAEEMNIVEPGTRAYFQYSFAEELFELYAYGILLAVTVEIADRVRRPGSAEEIAARWRLDPAG